jgi:iron complex outermembrane recepter protein
MMLGAIRSLPYKNGETMSERDVLRVRRRSPPATLGVSAALSCFGALVLGTVCLTASAQTSSGSASSSSTANASTAGQYPSGTGLEEIVVTAQKRVERLLDVPSSIIAVTATTLQEQHAVGLDDYVALVPGLSLNTQPGGIQQISIRGISTGTGGNPTVSTYLDNAPVGASTLEAGGGGLTPDIDPNDIQQIEVLRGPQGTLYGADNLGGLIKYDLVAPNLNELGGRAWFDAEDVEHGDVGFAERGRISIPLIDGKLALLVSGFHRDDPGFIDNVALGLSGVNRTSSSGGRVALLWDVTDTLAIQLSAFSNQRKLNGAGEEDVDPRTLASLYGDLTQRRAGGTGNDEDIWRLYTGTIDWDLGVIKISSTTSYNTEAHSGTNDYTGFLAGFEPPSYGNLGYSLYNGITQSKLSEELRLSSHVGSWFDWRVGGFFTHEDGGIAESIPTINYMTGAPVAIPNPILDALTTAEFKEWAVFGEGTLHFTSQFDLTGGLRYSHNDQNILQDYSGVLTGLVYNRVLSSDSATTFLVTPRFKLDDNFMLYARVASGYRPGGPNYPTNPPTPATYGPDRDVNYELGAKATFPEQRLSFDAAVFYVDWTDIQLNITTPSGLEYTANAGSASSRGLELSASYSPLPALTLSTALSRTDAKLDAGLPSGAIGAKGDVLPYTPRFKATVDAEYAFKSWSGWTPYLAATYLFNGSESTDFPEALGYPRIELPAYQTIAARTGLRNDRWTLEVYAKNIADTRGFTSAAALTGSPTGPYAMGVIQPRTVGITVIASF